MNEAERSTSKGTVFSFADHAENFKNHIRLSIPGYETLLKHTVALSPRFIQDHTKVLDIGCSAATLLTALHSENVGRRTNIDYVGIDREPAFAEQWEANTCNGIHFEICDARSYCGYNNISLACSNFTIQFLPPQDKLPLLQSIFDGLVKGGAFIIAEKTLASTARLQDALTFPYYDFKLRKGFSAQEILDKERDLRGQMTLWTAAELEQHLRTVGFNEVERVWDSFPFSAYLAIREG